MRCVITDAVCVHQSVQGRRVVLMWQNICFESKCVEQFNLEHTSEYMKFTTIIVSIEDYFFCVKWLFPHSYSYSNPYYYCEQEVLTHFQSLSHFPQSYEEELHEMPRVMQLVNQVLKDKAMRKALDEKATVQASIENQFANFGKVIMKDFDFCLQEIEVSFFSCVVMCIVLELDCSKTRSCCYSYIMQCMTETTPSR